MRQIGRKEGEKERDGERERDEGRERQRGKSLLKKRLYPGFSQKAIILRAGPL